MGIVKKFIEGEISAKIIPYYEKKIATIKVNLLVTSLIT